jgi:PAS domain S-box-containing protein
VSYSKHNIVELFLIGKTPAVNSISEYRRILLVGAMSLLLIFINAIYASLNIYYHLFHSQILYISLFIVSSLAFILNRLNYHTVSKLILILCVNISVYLFSSSCVSDIGTYTFYFPLLLLAFAFFDYNNFQISVYFTGLSFTLFLIDYFTEFSFLKSFLLPDNLISHFKILNYSISFFISFILLSYLVQVYHLAESNLINHQKQLDELTRELKESEQRYELAMTGTNAGIWDWDLKNNKIYHGLRWKEILGYTIEDDLNISIDNFYPLVHPDDVTRVQDALKDHFDNRVPYNIEYRIRKKDEGFEWIYDAGKAIWNDSGAPVRMVGSIINISKRKQDEQRIRQQNEMLEKANAELDRFVYITSHDLKAPLLSILGLINIAEMSNDKSETEQCLKMMRERVIGLEKFISDIIDYSRNVRVGVVKEVIKLNKIVNSIINDFLFVENVNKIHFDLSIDPELEFISDQKRITVILKNLISNAIKYHNYNQATPQIKINGNLQEKNIVISVHDNGDGIDPEIQPKIFDMFFRGTEKSDGSGLGLYIVKEMIEKLNGNISVSSCLNEGSHFTVTLPLNT